MSVKLTDFDSAREFETPLSTLHVTPVYTSPEGAAALWAGAPLVASAAHDMFCAGLIVYYVMDAEHTPAFADDAAARGALLGTATVVVDVARCRNDSTTLHRLLGRLLSRDPALRPAAADVLRDDYFSTHGAHTLQVQALELSRLSYEAVLGTRAEVAGARAAVAGTHAAVVAGFEEVRDWSWHAAAAQPLCGATPSAFAYRGPMMPLLCQLLTRQHLTMLCYGWLLAPPTLLQPHRTVSRALGASVMVSNCLKLRCTECAHHHAQLMHEKKHLI